MDQGYESYPWRCIWVCIAAMDRMWVQGTDWSLTFWAMANISHIIPKDCHRDGMRLLEARSTKAHWSIEEPGRLEQFFPECVARIPVSLWGSGGWGCVRSTLRLRSQPSATVRNHSREGPMAVPMVSSAEGVLFGGFKRLVASFHMAGVALRDIQTCFVTCRKWFCVAGAILLWRFRKVSCSYRGRCNTLDVSIVILRGRGSTLDVSCCVFFANRIGVKWRQGADSVVGVAFCEMCWKLKEASHFSGS